MKGHLMHPSFPFDSNGVDFCVAKFAALNNSESPLQLPGTSRTHGKSFEGNYNSHSLMHMLGWNDPLVEGWHGKGNQWVVTSPFTSSCLHNRNRNGL